MRPAYGRTAGQPVTRARQGIYCDDLEAGVIEQLPGGIVTFLMSDIEGSTRLWEVDTAAMSTAMTRHDQIVSSAVTGRMGHVLKERGEGDSRFAVFSSGLDALAAAVDIQSGIAGESWSLMAPLRIRVGIHTGFANPVGGDYYGSAVNRCARIRSLGHGGQTLMSMSTHEVIKDDPLPGPVTLRDLGEHFLKDLTRPERLFQVDVDGLPAEFPELSSVASTPNNIPKQLTEFVGRQQELNRMQSILGASRLVTILAPGGTGKTRLALEVAGEMIGEYPHGVFVVEMAPLTSPSQMAQTIAEAIDVPLSSEGDLLGQLLRYLVNKRLLLIMDNFEHLVEGASLVDEILHTAPLVTVLATSRIKLGLGSETILTLPGLDVSWETEEEASTNDGVRLFTIAAQRANPGFTLSEPDVAPLRQILEMVEGMPLGILLAAGWVDMLSVQEIAAEISKSADFLETQMGHVSDRHRSIRAVFEYTWALLSPEEREMFAALSVFRGGFTRDAAEFVANASLRGLSNLVDKALVVADRERGRFAVHELLRQYGSAVLDSTRDIQQQVTRRHASFYSDVMAQAWELIQECDQRRALVIMEAELDNIRTSWRYYATENDPGAQERMAKGLWFLHEVRGWYPAALDLYEESDALPVTRAARAWFQSLLSRPDLGVESAEKAARDLDQSPDRNGLLFALQSLCLSSMYLGDLDRMKAASGQMMTLAVQERDPWWIVVGLCWVMFPEMFDGRVADAQQTAQSAFDEGTRLGDHWCRTFALYCLAQAAMVEGRPGDALVHLQRSEAINREIGYRRGLQWALNAMGQASAASGDLVSADGYYLESLETSYDLGQTREMLEVLVRIARVRMDLGDTGAAAELLGTILSDPTAAQIVPPDPATIYESAEQMRIELATSMDHQTLVDAIGRGSLRPTELAARELLTGTHMLP